MKRVCAAAVAFAILGCGGGGGGSSTKNDIVTCPQNTNLDRFEANDYAGQRVSGGDPLSAYQWHLKSFGQKTGNGDYAIAGNDLNVAPVWKSDFSGYTGKGVTIAIVDTGVDSRNPDLAPNLNKAASVDLDPDLQGDNCSHGTMTAGIAAAKGGNGGMIGVAPNAEIVGANIFSRCGGRNSSYAQASALTPAKKTIFSNSWGCSNAFANNCVTAAVTTAIRSGAIADGKESIYVFAAGNEREIHQRSDYAEHENLFEVIPVAALIKTNAHSSYSNPGANLLISAYGGGTNRREALIATTDTLGCRTGTSAQYGEMEHTLNESNGYTTYMNGTSAATPMVSGVIALMREANGDLTFREIRYILAATARKNHADNAEWAENGAGFHINHNYGFGLIDAEKAVEMAKTFSLFSTLKTEQIDIDGTGGVSVSSAIDKIEFVNLELKMGDYKSCYLDISLTSPSGTSAKFVDKNYQLKSNDLSNHTFGTPRFLDEDPNGTWQVKIEANPITCPYTLNSAKITIRGR
ncbi:serine protease [Campylobacterota bacterium]|nr:serine protease [Campylobacterota bacterium]